MCIEEKSVSYLQLSSTHDIYINKTKITVNRESSHLEQVKPEPINHTNQSKHAGLFLTAASYKVFKE